MLTVPNNYYDQMDKLLRDPFRAYVGMYCWNQEQLPLKSSDMYPSSSASGISIPNAGDVSSYTSQYFSEGTDAGNAPDFPAIAVCHDYFTTVSGDTMKVRSRSNTDKIGYPVSRCITNDNDHVTLRAMFNNNAITATGLTLTTSYHYQSLYPHKIKVYSLDRSPSSTIVRSLIYKGVLTPETSGAPDYCIPIPAPLYSALGVDVEIWGMRSRLLPDTVQTAAHISAEGMFLGYVENANENSIESFSLTENVSIISETAPQLDATITLSNVSGRYDLANPDGPLYNFVPGSPAVLSWGFTDDIPYSAYKTGILVGPRKLSPDLRISDILSSTSGVSISATDTFRALDTPFEDTTYVEGRSRKIIDILRDMKIQYASPEDPAGFYTPSMEITLPDSGPGMGLETYGKIEDKTLREAFQILANAGHFMMSIGTRTSYSSNEDATRVAISIFTPDDRVVYDFSDHPEELIEPTEITRTNIPSTLTVKYTPVGAEEAHSTTVKVRSGSPNEVTWENPLITTVQSASYLASWMVSEYYSFPNVVTFHTRGTPEIQVGDVVQAPSFTDSSKKYKVRIFERTVSYSGGMRGTLKGVMIS